MISCGGVALEPLRARVPAGDHAAGIEHVDGVVGDRLDQYAIAGRFFQYRHFRAGPLGLRRLHLNCFLFPAYAPALRV